MFVTWFTVSRVIVTFWNGISFFYHFLWIGINPWTSLIIQGSALIIEYFLCGWYERKLIWSNNKIEEKTMFVPLRGFKRIILKYIAFTIIFISVYVSTYCLRLGFFYFINFGVNINQLHASLINMVWLTSISAPIMGAFVIERKKRIHHIELKPQRI